MTDSKRIPNLTLEQDDSLPLRDVVCKTLRDAILEGKIKPGTRLMELHLASQLGVSRTPVREAIRLLEMDGLVHIHPRRGAVVADISEADLRDVLEVRQALEELAVRTACRYADDEVIRQLEEAEKAFERTLGLESGGGADAPGRRVHFHDGTFTEMAEADVAFHEIITDASHNRRLQKLLTGIREQIFRYRLENLKDPASYPHLIGDHRALIDALKAGDEEAAARAILRHIENQKNAILQTL